VQDVLRSPKNVVRTQKDLDNVKFAVKRCTVGIPNYVGDKILHGLNQSYHHISELGLSESIPAKEIAMLKSEVEKLPEGSLDRMWRQAFSEKLLAVVIAADLIVTAKQPNFRPGPEN
jgi:hypothetical protein